jgi:hypothetical protein
MSKFTPSNIKDSSGCNVGITDGRDLVSAPLRRHDKRTKFHEDWYRRSSNIKVLPQKFENL